MCVCSNQISTHKTLRKLSLPISVDCTHHYWRAQTQCNSCSRYLHKKNIEIQPGFETGSSKFRSDMLLPMSYWSSGFGAEDRWHLSIDTVRFSGWISLRLGELCMISTELLCATTSKLGNNSSYSVCAIRTPIYRDRPETFLLPNTKCLCQPRL